MTRTRYKILLDDNYPYFVTATTIYWLPLFSNPDIAAIIFDSLRFLQQNKRILIYAYGLMENHLHLVVSSENLSKELANFKSFTARQIIDYYQQWNFIKILDLLVVPNQSANTSRRYRIWQEGFGPKRIKDKEMMLQKIEYIHHNPVRCGFVDAPEHWRYSSARNYSGSGGMLDLCMDW